MFCSFVVMGEEVKNREFYQMFGFVMRPACLVDGRCGRRLFLNGRGKRESPDTPPTRLYTG